MPLEKADLKKLHEDFPYASRRTLARIPLKGGETPEEISSLVGVSHEVTMRADMIADRLLRLGKDGARLPGNGGITAEDEADHYREIYLQRVEALVMAKVPLTMKLMASEFERIMGEVISLETGVRKAAEQEARAGMPEPNRRVKGAAVRDPGVKDEKGF